MGSVIIGATTLQQLEENIKACEVGRGVGGRAGSAWGSCWWCMGGVRAGCIGACVGRGPTRPLVESALLSKGHA